MIFLTQEASKIPLAWVLAANARFTVNDIWHDLPENILIATTPSKEYQGLCYANHHDALITVSEEYGQDPTGLYTTLVQSMLHACIGCQNKESDNNQGEWLKRVKYLKLEV